MAAEAHGKSTEIAASFVLLGATVLALVLANSGLAGAYKAVLGTEIRLGIGGWELADQVKGWIKNALMAVFFLFVGLEIKYEFRDGALSDPRRAALPFAAAAGGMALPAAVYLLMVGGDPALAAGWAIPSATDIAFAIGVVGLLGARVPVTLKAFLLAVAVIDDIGAILIIALFYTAEVHPWALVGAGGTAAVLLGMNLGGVRQLGPYMLAGLALWVFFMESGVSATLAGVLLAFFIPLRVAPGAGGHSPLHLLMAKLKPGVLFLIMPVFALANAGVPLAGLGLGALAHPVTAGIALGLFVGKPIGILACVWLAQRSGLARLPAGATWLGLLGVAWLAGIGFTMSLFIGVLAFESEALMDQVRLGVLAGSTLAALAGVAVIMAAARRAPRLARKPA
ncbi:Na+/H+ antiporter NhaA [Falsiroseomonas sp.]|uniref:Na+/H+ antiporter NhaA n=1 Tax=Falsiroseomonas sp. TaxID=2870721 RepID=UPI0034A43599